ncbi:alpha/beta fold hydrolase [Methylopila turkensis]|uniref:Alpha/beta hydrolase n=1 Tax=Methylopila turkensis TaxID=1437816 RepID=A0A9W6N850_9HYPH|nr:alpha/beta hydrolase [Methylopila turkensis]GLK81115.1 alpha/beta hydrolase [Methylopila turkensis]
MTGGAPAPQDRRVATVHGPTLHVRDWTPPGADGPPVVGLPGLSRPLEDFTELAEHLASTEGGGRRVIAISARGRGLSDRDPEPKRYDVTVETGDVLTVLDALGVGRAILVGTSRGGMQAMALAAIRPAAVAGLVLNDIGPVVEADGLLRIRDYLKERAAPRNWRDATEAVAALMAERFTALGPADFERIARRTWREENGELVALADPALAATFQGLDLTKPLPPLWALFDALAATPLMAIRGSASDILSAETFAAMRARRPDITAIEVPGEGHAPQLADRPTLDAIAAFVAEVAGRERA